MRAELITDEEGLAARDEWEVRAAGNHFAGEEDGECQ